MTKHEALILEIELNGGFDRHFRLLTAAHDRQLARKGAIAGNHGWVVVERGMCSKTNIGCLDTTYVSPGKYTHRWFDRETDRTLYPADKSIPVTLITKSTTFTKIG